MANIASLDDGFKAFQAGATPNTPTASNPAQLDAGFNQFKGAQQSSPQQSAQSNLDTAVQSLQRIQQQPTLAQHYQAVTDAGNSVGSSTMAFIDNFNKQMSSLPNGVMQLMGLGNLKADGGISVNDQVAMHNRDAQIAEQNHPVAAGFGNLTGIIGNGVDSYALGGAALKGMGTVMPEAAGSMGAAASQLAQDSPLLAKMGGSALQNSAWASAQATQGDQSHLTNAVGGGVLGALLPPGAALAGDIGGRIADTGAAKYLSGAVNRVVPGVAGLLNKTFNPSGAATSELGDILDKFGVTPEKLAADMAPAQRIGANLSLGEAITGANKGIASLEARMGAGNLEASKMANDHINNNVAVLGDQISNISDKLVPEGNPVKVGQQVSDGYDALKQYNISPDDLSALGQNKTISDYLAHEQNAKILPEELQNMPIANSYKLNDVIKTINNDLYKNTSSITQDATRQMSDTERMALQEAKTKIGGAINNVVPNNQYSQLTDLAQRNIERNSLMGALNDAVKGTANMKPDGTMETSIESLYNKLWKTPDQQQKFMDIVQKAGGNPQLAQDIMYTANHVVNTPVQKILSGTRVAAETNKDAEDKIGLIKSALNSLTTNDYKNAMLKLSLGDSGSTAGIAKAMESPSLGQKIINLNNALGGIAQKAAVSQVINPTDAAHRSSTNTPSIMGGLK